MRGRALGRIREERERTSGEHRGSSGGESEQKEKEKDGADQKQDKEDLETAAAAGHTDCFIVSGSKVLEGVGSYVVVAVGTRSFNGRIMMGASVVLSPVDYHLTVTADVTPSSLASPTRRRRKHASPAEAERSR